MRDSYLASYLDTKYGSGNGLGYTPAHRGLSWISFNNYGLRRGRVPNFTVEVTNEDNEVNDILTTFAADVGIASGDLLLTATEGLTVDGFLESRKNSRRSQWEALGQFFSFQFAEIDGKLRTIPDTFTPLSPAINGDVLRAHDYGSEVKPYDAEIMRMSQFEMPREVRLTVSNPSLDYLRETVSATLTAGDFSNDTADYDFPLVASSEFTRQQAERMLLKIHAETRTATFTAMPEMMKYSVGDVIEIPLNGDTYTLRIDAKRAALPLGTVEMQGTILEPYEAGEIETAVVPTELSNVASLQEPFFQPPRNAVAVPIVSVPIRDADKGKLGCYVAVTPFGAGVAETVTLHQEIAEDTYIIREIYEVPSAVGVSLEALPDWGTYPAEDTTNYVDIYFFNRQTLETVTAEELDRNPQLNLVRVGNEWVQFRTATAQPLDPDSVYRSKWRISNLRRGLFGTDAALDGHEENEYCTLVTNNFRFYELDRSDIGEDVTFVAVSAGGILEMSPKATFEFNPISAYTVTNASDDRSYDANSTSINELADVLATVIKDSKL